MIASPATSRRRRASGRRALNQAARELLLAQSSDWAFIMKTGTMVEYAIRRTKEHLLRFTRLHDQIRAGTLDAPWLEHVEGKDNIFPEIDWRVYRPLPGARPAPEVGGGEEPLGPEAEPAAAAPEVPGHEVGQPAPAPRQDEDSPAAAPPAATSSH